MNIDREFIELILLVIFFLFSAFFSASETAFMAIDKLWIEIKVLADKKGKNRKIRKIKQITSEPGTFLSAILVGNNLVNVAVSSIGTALAIKWFGEEQGVVIATIFITLFLLIFSEVTPKTIASYKPEKITELFVYPIDFFIKLFAPISYFVDSISHGIIKILGIKIEKKESGLQRGHIKHLLKLWEEQGILSDVEEKMVRGLLSLKTLAVEHVMKPRDKVVVVEEGNSFEKLLSTAVDSHFSRFPVVDPESGLVKGVVHVKDLLRFCRSGGKEFNVDMIMRKPVFVHPEKNLWELFLILTKSRGEMAIVVNEYGDFLGIVTLEEILEEIVGEIYDEYDAFGIEEIKLISENIYEVDGRITLHKLEENLEVSFPPDEGKILSEYLINISGRELKEGEIVEDDELIYKILKMKGYHPEKVRIIKKSGKEIR